MLYRGIICHAGLNYQPGVAVQSNAGLPPGAPVARSSRGRRPSGRLRPVEREADAMGRVLQCIGGYRFWAGIQNTSRAMCFPSLTSP